MVVINPIACVLTRMHICVRVLSMLYIIINHDIDRMRTRIHF